MDTNEVVTIGGREYGLSSFMSAWDRAYYWMNKWGVPLLDWQKQRLSRFTPPKEQEPSKESMAYYITERCENVRDKSKIPPEFGPIIDQYKTAMMETWGWPDWGYRDVKKKRSLQNPQSSSS